MRVLIQRVTSASLTINNKVHSSIANGMVVLIGIEEADNLEDVEWISSKLVQLRIFNDSDGVMNLSIKDINGNLLLISQFTLHATTKKGNRPSYIKAAKPITAIPIYQATIECIEKKLGKSISTGVFGADMQVSLTNDGPVSIWIDSKNKE